MMEEKPSVIRVYAEGNAIIGKCHVCMRQIENDPKKFWCRETRMINTKCYCGGCLLDLWDVVNDVNKSYTKERDRRHAGGLGVFYSIDEATGRLVVIE